MKTHRIFYIVGAGDFHTGDLPPFFDKGDMVCAADAGYLNLKKMGIVPDLLIGDFDSMPEPEKGKETEKNMEIIKLPVIKDDTDIGYAVKEGLKRGYDSFVICGALGGKRMSHSIANIELLSMIKEKGGRGELISGNTKIRVIKEGEREEIEEKKGTHFSAFALTEKAEITLSGLFYPLDHGVIERSFPLGVSNHFTEEKALVEVHKGEILVIIEKP